MRHFALALRQHHCHFLVTSSRYPRGKTLLITRPSTVADLAVSQPHHRAFLSHQATLNTTSSSGVPVQLTAGAFPGRKNVTAGLASAVASLQRRAREWRWFCVFALLSKHTPFLKIARIIEPVLRIESVWNVSQVDGYSFMYFAVGFDVERYCLSLGKITREILLYMVYCGSFLMVFIKLNTLVMLGKVLRREGVLSFQ